MSEANIETWTRDKVTEVVQAVIADFSDDNARHCAQTVTALRLLGGVTESLLKTEGPEAARTTLTAFLGDFARNLSRGERAVKITVEWREGV